MKDGAPFLVLASPRSRSFWLSRFLSYGKWYCGHDEAKHFRSLENARKWFKQPFTGTVETSVTPFWRLIPKNVRVLVIRRDPEAVLASWYRGGGTGDSDHMLQLFRHTDRKLEQAAARLNAPQYWFEDLAQEDACRNIFSYCLGIDFNQDWYAEFATKNLQISIPALLRYCEVYGEAMLKIGAHARHASFASIAKKHVQSPDGFVFSYEPFRDAYRDAQELVRSHMVATEQGLEDFTGKNLELLDTLSGQGLLRVLTARSNGRMFGYLLTLIAPSLDDPLMLTAQHLPIFADNSVPGLGRAMLRRANEDLKNSGIDEVFVRAGTRGAGPRLGKIYERMGAEPAGSLYRFGLEDSKWVS